MNDVKLLAYRVSKFDFVNDVDDEGQIELKFDFFYDVKYDETDKTCLGSCTVEVGKIPEFSMKFTVQGIFGYDADMSKEEIHRQTFFKLYPYAKVFASSFSASAGILPIALPEVDSSLMKIKQVD